MSRYLLFNKPFQVLTQFTDPDNRQTLADFIDVPEVYSAGRLDYDSEGLLLLTDDGALIHSMMNPRFKTPKTYLAQVEGDITDEAIRRLESGLQLKDGPTLPAKARRVSEPAWLWPRQPPIRERATIPASWVELTLVEGRNRQVRRMTAAVGFPTLRLIRVALAELTVESLSVGQYKEVDRELIVDNGIKWQIKKSSPKAAHSKHQTTVKRQDRRRHRNRRPQSRNRKV
ncbi:pseudouridine synthase [Reinekea blandensis]|uniref:Pseudouridine synthase n=1 Tax=Reinekea blandensis MED297 TaxID=314283 RepID=A4BDP6_9GAMM|nr:pseudouridine synthase [Reinekea blandensis]EAR09655.1 Pseudouridine synthase, Rsu [Reinekea blandensis MED297]